MLSKQVIEEPYSSVLRDLLCMYVGEGLELRVILNPNSPAQPARETAPLVAVATPPAESALSPQSPFSSLQLPARVAAERWVALPIMLRAALADSELVAGVVHCRSPHLGRVLTPRYAREVDALIAAA